MSTDEPFGFVYVKLGSKTVNDMFYGSLKKKIILIKYFSK
jgi:hypothetical protein